MRIGVIGGGTAGLVTAWLLQSQHQVTLFEKDSRLGGHAHTVDAETPQGRVAVESGFEFFVEEHYPLFVRLLNALELRRRPFPVTFSLSFHGRAESYALPPFRGDKRILGSLFHPRTLSYLVQFGYLMARARRIVSTRDTTVTLDEFLARTAPTRHFVNEFFYPWVSGGWCADMADFRGFSAYEVFKYAIQQGPDGARAGQASEIEGGTRAYVDRMRRALLRTDIRTGVNLGPVQFSNGQFICKPDGGEAMTFDRIVVATNARQAAELLREIPFARPLCDVLRTIRYFQSPIAIHGDRSWMPARRAHWSVFNVRWNGQSGVSTVWKDRPGQIPVFRSWTRNASTPPESVWNAATYEHAIVDPAYFRSQRQIREMQGRGGIWLAGTYTHDIDSHESAVWSGVSVAGDLAPDAAELSLLRPWDRSMTGL